jgi:hypothetical protein
MPFLGIPGIVRFIDVRTQWFDEAMEQAFDDGIQQVRPVFSSRLSYGQVTHCRLVALRM